MGQLRRNPSSVGEPEDVARIALFLASGEARMDHWRDNSGGWRTLDILGWAAAIGPGGYRYPTPSGLRRGGGGA